MPKYTAVLDEDAIEAGDLADAMSTLESDIPTTSSNNTSSSSSEESSLSNTESESDDQGTEPVGFYRRQRPTTPSQVDASTTPSGLA